MRQTLEHHMSDEERVKVAIQVDYFVDVISKRYGLEPSEIIEAVRWVQQHREFVSKLKHGGVLGLITTILMATLVSVWEGVKALIGRAQ